MLLTSAGPAEPGVGGRGPLAPPEFLRLYKVGLSQSARYDLGLIALHWHPQIFVTSAALVFRLKALRLG